MAKVTVSIEEFRRLMKKYADIFRPDRYYVVEDGMERFIFVPIKTSRHLHYYEVRTKGGEEYEKFKQELKNRGFEVILGEVTFLPG